MTQNRTATASAETGYAQVRGLNLYDEIHGVGEPLILLHGGVVGIEMFGPNLSELAQTRQVVAVELQGHGRTADIDRPLSFEAMADADAVRLTHIVEFFGLLGGGQKDAGLDGSGRPAAQLAILPGLTHYTISASPALAPVVAPFLDAPLASPKELP